MRAWRRKSSTSGASAAAPAPLITVVFDIGGGNGEVTFDQPVLWDSLGAGQLLIAGQPAVWIFQVDPSTLRFNAPSGIAVTDSVTWAAADTSLSPVPNPSDVSSVS